MSKAPGKQRFSEAFATGATQNLFDYFISHRSAHEWERGTGHMSDAGTLVRDTVLENSNCDTNPVSFADGTKDVSNAIPADRLATIALTVLADGEGSTIPKETAAVRTLGYINPADGGGALYKRVVSQPSHEGTFRSRDRFRPDGSVDPAHGGWWEIAETRLNVRQFGAKGNGTAIDTAPFANGVACVEAIGGGVLDIPRGTYPVAIDVTHGNVWLRGEPGVRLIAAGPLSVFKVSDTVTGPVLLSDVVIRGQSPANLGTDIVDALKGWASAMRMTRAPSRSSSGETAQSGRRFHSSP